MGRVSRIQGAFLTDAVNHIMLVCPSCKGNLSFTQVVRLRGQIQRGRIACGSCGAQFEVAARIPILLPPGQFADWSHTFVQMLFGNIRITAQEAIEKYGVRKVKNLYRRLLKGEYKPSLVFKRPVDRKLIAEGGRRITKRAIEKHFENIRKQTEGVKSETEMVRYVRKAKPKMMLDQCSGGGFFLGRLFQDFTGYGQLFSFDVDYHCAKIVEGILRSYRLTDKSLSIVADARARPFPSNFFDLITSNYGFSDMIGYSKALRETYRTLKPGGYLVLRQGFGLARYPRSKELLKGFTAAELIRLHKFGDAYVGKESFLESVENQGFIIDKVHDFKDEEGGGSFLALCRKPK